MTSIIGSPKVIMGNILCFGITCLVRTVPTIQRIESIQRHNWIPRLVKVSNIPPHRYQEANNKCDYTMIVMMMVLYDNGIILFQFVIICLLQLLFVVVLCH